MTSCSVELGVCGQLSFRGEVFHIETRKTFEPFSFYFRVFEFVFDVFFDLVSSDVSLAVAVFFGGFSELFILWKNGVEFLLVSIFFQANKTVELESAGWFFLKMSYFGVKQGHLRSFLGRKTWF